MGMHPFPHRYSAAATCREQGSVAVTAEGIEALATHAPPEFGGPAGHWSPETLLVASIADCFALSFRVAARAADLPWEKLEVDVEGLLDREGGVTRFTQFVIRPRLHIGAVVSPNLAHSALRNAKRMCLITNSLSAECDLQPEIVSLLAHTAQA